MNCSDRNRHGGCEEKLDERLLGELLAAVRERFYAGKPTAEFHRDRRRLIYALSWPADWLGQRGLFCPPSRYRAIVVARLDAVRAHGDPARYGAFFPSYLLKCLQDHFAHHGEELYDELKHIRNALELASGALRFADDAALVHARQIDVLAHVHRLLRVPAPSASDPRQLALF